MTDARAKRPPPGPPPTIGYLRDQGVTKSRVSCDGAYCDHGKDMTCDQLGFPDDTSVLLDRDPAPVGMPALRIPDGECDAAMAEMVTTGAVTSRVGSDLQSA